MAIPIRKNKTMANFRTGRYDDHDTLDEAISAASSNSLRDGGKPTIVYQAFKTVTATVPVEYRQVEDYVPDTKDSNDE